MCFNPNNHKGEIASKRPSERKVFSRGEEMEYGVVEREGGGGDLMGGKGEQEGV